MIDTEKNLGMKKLRSRILQPGTMTLARLLPNIVTILNLSAGLMAIRFALYEHWQWAVGALVIAAFLDTLDGRMARLLSGGTRFGVELDSLSDFLSFSLAPALVLYFWVGGANGVLWATVMIYVTCGALRLARFNADDTVRSDHFFQGIPSPAAAGFVLLPMIAWLQWELEWLRHFIPVAIFLVCVGFSMVSNIPAWSLKRLQIRPKRRLAALLIASLFLILLLNFFWLGVLLIVLGYGVSIPIGMRHLKKRR